jgi:hypothetical protein
MEVILSPAGHLGDMMFGVGITSNHSADKHWKIVSGTLVGNKLIISRVPESRGRVSTAEREADTDKTEVP